LVFVEGPAYLGRFFLRLFTMPDLISTFPANLQSLKAAIQRAEAGRRAGYFPGPTPPQ
jgi:hypothetical protein